MAQYKPNNNTGAIIVGSHVKKSTQQLSRLLQESDIQGIEINVNYLREFNDEVSKDTLLSDCLIIAENARKEGKTPVFYTSREELTFPDVETRLEFGKKVSSFLMDIVRNLPRDISFLISKGGITSNDVLSDGLSLKEARLLGQILAGCSVITTPQNHHLFPSLPVVLFPGNVGDIDGLVTVYQRLNKH